MTDDLKALAADIKEKAEKANAANSVAKTRALTSAEHWHVNDFYDIATPATVLRLISALEEAQRERDAIEMERAEQWRQRREAQATADVAKAACDTLRAENGRLRDALGIIDADGVRAKMVHAPEDKAVQALCKQFGYGAVMDAAARMWFLLDPVGALTVGPCAGTVRRARNVLKETDHG